MSAVAEDRKSSSGSSFEKGHDLEQNDNLVVQNAKLDVSLALPGMVGDHERDVVSPEESRRVRRKMDIRMVPLLMLLYGTQYMDKNGIGSSAILGFLQDNNLTMDQYNTLNSLFYVGLLVSQWPHSWALQHFPVAKYMSVMIFIWGFLNAMLIVGGSYGGLIPIRFLLGVAEGCVTPALMLITSMFFTRVETAERIGWSFQCNGIAQIIVSFIAFGVYHAPPNTPENPQKIAQWQWFFLVITIITVAVGALFLVFFPDSPTTAKFLTQEEKVIVIRRMKENQSGVETKVWKWDQFWECLKDPKAYFFLGFAIFMNFVSGVGTQYALIIKDFGFNVMETTLLSMPSGATMVISITTGCYLLRKFPNSRTQIAIFSYVPTFIGISLLLGLSGSNRIGLLISFYVMQLGQAPAVIMSLSWVTATTSGHTKKVVMNSFWLIGYSIGQMVAPQWWKDKYKPRNRVPWTIILVSHFIQIAIIIALRFYLVAQNRKRDEAATAAFAAHQVPAHDSKEEPHPDLAPYLDYSVIEIPDESAPGGTRKERVEKRFLDLTDRENLSFRYVL